MEGELKTRKTRISVASAIPDGLIFRFRSAYRFRMASGEWSAATIFIRPRQREHHKTNYCPSGKKLGDMMLDTNRLESMAIENSSSRLFVNMTGVNKIGVVDRNKRSVVATWPITAGEQNVPMQYDEARHRLFVVTRKPSKLVVVNTDTGKEVNSVPVAEYADDLAYDTAHHRLYVATGGLRGEQGAVSVVEQRDADNYQVIATIPTKPGAKTARLVPELNRYYVGVPGTAKDALQILAFEVIP